MCYHSKGIFKYDGTVRLFGAGLRKDLTTMSTKSCPFCGKEISDEAIICKFCHRLLIDENGKDIGAEDAYADAPAAEEDKTIVYSKDELQRALGESSADETEAAAEEYEYEDYQSADGETYADETYDEQYADDAQYDYGDGYDEGEYTYDEQSEVYANAYDDEYEDEQPQRYRSAARDNAANIPSVDYDPKRTFIVTIIVTLGILLIIIAAIVVGYKLFGFSDEGSSQAQLTTTTPAPAAVVPEDTVPVETEYAPQVTDDTVSESPEETSNSGLADPVVTPDSMVVVPGDSTADSQTADSSTDTNTDSAAPSEDSQASDESAADSQTEDSQVNDGPDGSYYTWDEAFELIANYFANNGMNGTYAYAYGEENSSMTFQYYDENGNPAGLYTVDLYTGAVYAV